MTYSICSIKSNYQLCEDETSVDVDVFWLVSWIKIQMFIADIKVHIQYKITIFKLKCYTDFTIQYKIYYI